MLTHRAISRTFLGFCLGLPLVLSFAGARAPRDGIVLAYASVSALFVALADVGLRLRALVFFASAGYLLLLLVGLLLWPAYDPYGPRLLARDEQNVVNWFTVYLLLIGLLAPLREYLGSVGPPRTAAAPQPTSLRTLFALTAYFAVVAIALSWLPRTDLAGVVTVSVAVWCATAGSVLCVLGAGKRVPALGAVCSLAYGGFVILGLHRLANDAVACAGFLLGALGLWATTLVAAWIARRRGHRLRR